MERVLKGAQIRLAAVEWIVRDPDHVEVRLEERSLGEDVVVPPHLRPRVPSVVEVHHDLGLRRQVAVLNAPCGGVEKGRDIIVGRGASEWPQEAIANLVANGYDAGCDSSTRERIGDGFGVLVDGVGECSYTGVIPGRRCSLGFQSVADYELQVISVGGRT